MSVLEGYYLFGIDEDLNGRMFEAFLTATMRGQCSANTSLLAAL